MGPKPVNTLEPAKPVEDKLEEVKVEDVKTELKEDTPILPPPPSLQLILNQMMETPDEKLKLTPTLKSMVLTLSNVRLETLVKIEKLLEKIMEDKKLDVKDVPPLISLLDEVYRIYMTLKMKDVKPEDCATLLKIVTIGLYNFKFKDKFTEEERETIMEGFNVIIDTAVTLIDLKDSVPKPRCLPSWCC